MLVVQTELPHVSQQLGRLPAAEKLHRQKKLDPLEISELMAIQEHLLQLGVGQQRSGLKTRCTIFFSESLSSAAVTWQNRSF